MLLAVAALAACGDDDTEASGDGVGSDGGGTGTETIVVGADFEQSGPLQEFGKAGAEGVEMAFAQINEAGGAEIDGTTYTFEVKLSDNQSDAGVTVGNIQSLVDAKVPVVFGPLTGGIATAAQELTQPNSILHFSPATPWEPLVGTPDHQYLFKTQLAEPKRAAIEVPAILEALPEVKTIAALLQDDPNGRGFWASMSKEFEAHGIEIIAEEYHQPGTTDFTPILTSIQSKGPDALFFGYTDDAAAAIFRQAKEIGFDVPFMTRGVSTAPFEDPGDSIILGTATSANLDAPTSPEAEKFVSDYTEHFDRAPGPQTRWALTFYDYVFAWVDAAKAAGGFDDPDAVAAALDEISYQGVLSISFEDRISVHDFDTFRIEDGETTWTRVG